MPFSLLNCLQAWRKSLNPPARAGVPQVLVINPEKCLQGREKETSVAENEPNQILMIAPLAIYDNEDVNEGAPGGLCQPLASFFLTKVWQGQWHRFFILVARSPLICSICCNKPKGVIFHEGPTAELASSRLEWGFCLENEGGMIDFHRWNVLETGYTENFQDCKITFA